MSTRKQRAQARQFVVDWISYGLEKSTPEDKGVLAEVERLREKLTPTPVAEYPRTAPRSYDINRTSK